MMVCCCCCSLSWIWLTSQLMVAVYTAVNLSLLSYILCTANSTTCLRKTPVHTADLAKRWNCIALVCELAYIIVSCHTGGPRAYHHLQRSACAHVRSHRGARPQCQRPGKACGQVSCASAHIEGNVHHCTGRSGPVCIQHIHAHQQQAHRHCSASARAAKCSFQQHAERAAWVLMLPSP